MPNVVPRGTKVIYLNKNGYPIEREYARKAGFVEGQEYTVTHCDEHSSSTSVYFYEIPGGWNSVMFGEVEQNE